jgi:hypothetical protein
MSNQVSFKRRLYFKYFQNLRKGLWGNFFQVERAKTDAAIPKTTLQEKNIRNLKTLTDREALLKQLPKDQVIAEVGVAHGDFSELITKLNSPKKLHLVDAWADESRYHGGLKKLVADKFKNEIEKGIVELNVGFSTTVLLSFPDGYFDWVYLDTDHSYETTRDELAILKSKVKKGGVIAGHDYTMGNWVNSYRYGVIEAVNEFCVKENWEIIFLTSEPDHHRSFAIREIAG